MTLGRFGVRVYKESFDFASAHFLIFADGAREQLHGHNYRVRVEVRGDLHGDMVLDFGQLKPLVRELCQQLDHRVLLPSENPHLQVTRDDEAGEIEAVLQGGGRFLFPAADVVVLPIPNTTTERLAEFVGLQLIPAVRERVPGARLREIEVEVEEAAGQSGFFVEALD